MKTTFQIRIWTVLFCCLVAGAWAQDSSQGTSLGDAARKARQQNAGKEHATADHVLDEEAQSARGLTLSVHACMLVPCSFMAVTVPSSAKLNQSWAGGAVVIPLKAADDRTHTIRVYSADLLNAATLNGAKQLFLRDWFSRPYYFGQPAKFDFDEQTTVDGHPANITHFTLPGKVVNYRGIAIVAQVPAGTFAFACVYRDDDSGDATSVCEGVMNSAKIDVPNQSKPNASAPVPVDAEDCGCDNDDNNDDPN
jgi:hypothetical protein